MSEGTLHLSKDTSVVVGIDEAGDGPLLGPLVVSAVAFDVPNEVLKALDDPATGPDLWALLKASVTPRVLKRDARLAVADSKKLHGKTKSGRGITLLEKAALAFLGQGGEGGQGGQVPTSLRTMLAGLCPHVVGQLDDYPWYAGSDAALPVDATADGVRIQVNALSRDMASAGVRFRGAWSEVLPAGEYNRLVSLTHNKATALFGQVTRLIQRISDSAGPVPLRVWCDRQGGRVTYRRGLMNAFDDAAMEVLGESPELSGYRLNRPTATWAVRFLKNGETHHLPIALASIISKYVRELMMRLFNDYWAQHVADLKPTAGYYQDGKRFLADIAEAVKAERIDERLLVRIS